MPKWCVVPNCKTVSKCSIFRVPKDIVTLKKWEQVIPGIIKLDQTDRVCEKHFKKEDIVREWVKLDANGQVITRVAYKRAQLKQFAVPTIFGNLPTGKKNCDPQHEYMKRVSDSDSQINSPSIFQSSSLTKLPAQGISTSVDVAPHIPSVADSFALQKSAKVSSSLEMTELISEENASTSDDFSADIPKGWSWVKMKCTESVQHTLFIYTIMKVDNGINCPVSQKSVILDEDRILKYFVYGRYIDTEDKNLERVLKKKEMLKTILRTFQGMNICKGLGDINIHDIPAYAYQDNVNKWRSKDCSLLSKKKTCNSCMKSRKCLLQRKVRLKNRLTMNRIGNISNPVDRCKLLAMRMKIRRERSAKLRAKNQVKHLITSIKAQEVQMASMQDTAVDKKLAELDNISKSQKENTKTWFTHPLNDKRKIFVFSDVCHLMKNVRNRLYNN
ncbi:PREDICTED: uncharacterized protein LOC105559571 [Vollenhovia emeryi]|uniref:uncharacterized protein LOC105559571 n=1 Tax=Vollenhovia emeryi TaxID=411798 RepID=UPI0005F55FD6|nr:PREDICTED: uncharacterized protein LOC105559571 [Vollenhovia emeryi]XP_011863357.1 PREDICTED: uncharacterized protein LOC105559571 [Vollenhovia emeryi]